MESAVIQTETVKEQPKQLFSDVIIVGAGPSGAAAALYMARAGLKVTVLEKAHFPRSKVCGDFVSPGTIKELQKMGVYTSEAFKDSNQIDQATVYLNGKVLAANSFPDVTDLPRFGRVMQRQILDSLIVAAARQAGATVLEGVQVKDFHLTEQDIVVDAEAEKESLTVHASLLVGADGNNSLVAKKLHGASGSPVERALTARGYFTNISGASNEANIYYNEESFPGCSWVFPMGNGEANVGVGVVLGAAPETEKPHLLLKKLIQTDPAMKNRLENAQLKGDLEVQLVNLYDSTAAIVGERVLLVGEAAGLTNPFNGEGVQLGLWSAKWASEAAVACRANNDFSQRALGVYSQRVEEELGYGFRLSTLIFGLMRNRNLNPVWLQWLEIMGQKSRADPEFARITSGVLSGMIYPNQQETAQAITGTLQEIAVSSGLTALANVLKNPAQAPQVTMNVVQTGLTTAEYVARDPLSVLLWGMETASKMVEVAAWLPRQALKDLERKEDTAAK